MARRVSTRLVGSARRFSLVALLSVLALGVWAAYGAFAAPPGPSVSSFTLNAASPTNASSVSWKVVFSATVTGVAPSNFTLVQGGGVSGAGSIAVSGSGSTYTISANTGSGSGTLGLNLSSAGSIKDSSNKALTGVPYTGPVYSVDKTPPAVASINRVTATPTNASSLSWTVTFSESVSGVDTTDFALAATGVSGASTSSVSGSGATYTVTASSGSGNGSLGLNLNDNDSIVDSAGNKLGGTGTGTVTTGGSGNGSFSGQVYAIDKTAPPTPAITSGPSGSGNPSSATFAFSDSESGVSYLCKLDSAAYAACSNPATFSGLADGSHTLTVQAKDAAGNVSAPSAARTWSVDATPPPKPTIVGPNNKSDSTAATFTITDSEANVAFMCSLDGSAYAGCASPKTYTLLTPGTHVFDAEAVDQAGNIGPFNEWKWTINGSSGSGQPFTIAGNASTTLYPGGAIGYLDLSLTNPNSVTIYVTGLTVSLAITAPHKDATHPCTAADFQLKQYSGSYPITVTPGPAKTLSALGATQAQLPSITMPDTHLNQDGCKGATLTFTYGGSAQS
jgi:hypothetical protein